MDVIQQNTGGQSLERIEAVYSELPTEGRAEAVAIALSVAADYGLELSPQHERSYI